MRPAVPLPSRLLLAGLAVLTLAGCGSSTVLAQPGGCTSRYDPVAAAASQSALRNLLLHDVDPTVKALRVVKHDAAHHKVTINLVDKNQKVVQSLDMWRKSDGTWVAEHFVPCPA